MPFEDRATAGELPSVWEDALARLPTRRQIASRILFFESAGSTNDIAMRLAEEGEAPKLAIIADTQTRGRGRLGRQWFSPPGSGLYVSVIVRPGDSAVDPVRASSLVTLMAGVALAEAIETSTGLAPSIKWPNDLLVGRRKLAGILAEALNSDVRLKPDTTVTGAVTPEAERVSARPRDMIAAWGASGGGPPSQELRRAWPKPGGGPAPRAGMNVVLGYGINVGLASYPPDLADRATSLEHELGRAIDRADVGAATFVALERWYGDLIAGRFDAILDAWRARAVGHMGGRVNWDTLDGVRRGVTEGIDERGALLVRTDSGLERLVAGEVRWDSF